MAAGTSNSEAVGRRVSCYVALGDSFSAGTGRSERWPDEVARSLGPAVRYENLARFGATSREVENEQLDEALLLRPNLVSLVCGANDVLESLRPDPGPYAARLVRMFCRLQIELPAATVVTATYPDVTRFLDLRTRTRARVRRGLLEFNAACRRVAESLGVICLEGWEHPHTAERDSYARDGLHPSPQGHRFAAREFVRALRELDIEIPQEEAA